jgi:rhamnose transport system permease protein
MAVLLLALAFVAGSRLSPFFLDAPYLLNETSLYMETGLIALAMTFIIISGNIDLSVASTLALVAGVTGVLHDHYSVPFGVAAGCGLALGAFLGWVNGLLIAWFRLPSLTVTLGTFALYRGLAQVLLGDQSVSKFPEWFVGIDTRHVGNSPLPLTLVVFLGLAVVAGAVLHRSVFGRWTTALGTNEAACRYSGIAVDRVKITLFTLSGFLSGLAGLLMTSRLTVARHDMGVGLELEVITAVVLGGTDIFGGRGTIFGTVVALFLIGILKSGMGLANIKAENQLVVIGLLLIFSVLLPNLLQKRRV